MLNSTNIVIGLTTAPRKDITIDQTINSLGRSGWTDIHIFAEPESYIPDSPYVNNVSRRKTVYGAWKNWFYSLYELYNGYAADYYFLCQDDVIVGPNTRELVEKIIWPADAGLISIFCPDMYKGRAKLNRVIDGPALRMAQTFIFPKKVVVGLLNSKEIWRLGGNVQIDNRVGSYLHSVNLYPYFHTPSLAQHIGHTSTIWPDVDATGMRAASDFKDSFS